MRLTESTVLHFSIFFQTPLHLAVITHQIYMVGKLIEGGADVNLMDRHGQTPLHLACQEGDVNCVCAIRDVTQISRFKVRLDLKNSQGKQLTTLLFHYSNLQNAFDSNLRYLERGSSSNTYIHTDYAMISDNF